MAKRSLAKLYDQLTGLERLRLVIEANARGDEIEVQRLVQSCPRERYSGGEDAYMVPMQAAWDLITAFCIDLAREQGRLDMIKSFQCYISDLGGTLSKMLTKDDRELFLATFEAISEALKGGYQKTIVARVKSMFEGLGQFSQRHLDLDHEIWLKAFAKPFWEWLEELKEELAVSESDPERVADYKKRLTHGWNLRVDGD